MTGRRRKNKSPTPTSKSVSGSASKERSKGKRSSKRQSTPARPPSPNTDEEAEQQDWLDEGQSSRRQTRRRPAPKTLSESEDELFSDSDSGSPVEARVARKTDSSKELKDCASRSDKLSSNSSRNSSASLSQGIGSSEKEAIYENKKRPKIKDKSSGIVETNKELVFIHFKLTKKTKFSEIKLYCMNRKKCKDFQGGSHESLVQSFCDYLTKFSNNGSKELTAVFMCVESCDMFKDLVPSSEKLFTRWTDINSIVMSKLDPNYLKAVSLREDRLKTLYDQVLGAKLKVTSSTPETVMMKEVMVKSTGSCDMSKLEEFAQGWRIDSRDHLVFVIHVGMVQMKPPSGAKESSTKLRLGTLSFRNSERGEWFVAVDPMSSQGKVNVESASQLGLQLVQDKKSKTDRWVFQPLGGGKAEPCLQEDKAMAGFLQIMETEVKSEAENGKKALLFSLQDDFSFILLMSVLKKHNLLKRFLAIVDGFASIEEVVQVKGTLSQGSFSLKALDQYFRTNFPTDRRNSQKNIVPLEKERSATLAKVGYKILSHVLGGKLEHDVLAQHVHPVESIWTHHKLREAVKNLGLDDLDEDVREIHLNRPLELNPGCINVISVTTSPRSVKVLTFSYIFILRAPVTFHF